MHQQWLVLLELWHWRLSWRYSSDQCDAIIVRLLAREQPIPRGCRTCQAMQVLGLMLDSEGPWVWLCSVAATWSHLHLNLSGMLFPRLFLYG